MLKKLFGSRDKPPQEAKSTPDISAYHSYSISAILETARQRGLYQPDGSFPIIPELIPVLTKASGFLFNIIKSQDRKYLETLMHHSCVYLFGKGIEAAFLWSKAPDGNVSLSAEASDMAKQTITTDLPSPIEQIVIQGMKEGEYYFAAHQNAMIQNQGSMNQGIIENEITSTLDYLPRIGVAYAISRGWHNLRWWESDSIGDSDMELDEMLQYADSLFSIGKPKEAIEQYNRVIETDPTNYNAWSNKGSALKALHNYEQALSCYEEALKIDPSSVIAQRMKDHLLALIQGQKP